MIYRKLAFYYKKYYKENNPYRKVYIYVLIKKLEEEIINGL